MLRHWKLKALFFKITSSNSLFINFFYFVKRLLYTQREVPNRLFKSRIKHAQNHLEAYIRQEIKLPESTLEIGTGWYPLVPIYFFLCNVKFIYTIDINQLLTYNQLIKTLEKFNSEEVELRKFEYLDAKNFEIINNILNNKKNFTLQSALAYLNIKYKFENFMDCDISKPIDLLHSNNTLEHIPKQELNEIIKKSKEIMKSKGIQSHFIDLSDHYSHKNSISNLNFLSYSSKEWKKYNSFIHYQNRLRPQDYIITFIAQSLEVVEIYPKTLPFEEQKKLKVHQEFANYTKDDLYVLNLYLVFKNIVN
jgi:hypothetical protein